VTKSNSASRAVVETDDLRIDQLDGPVIRPACTERDRRRVFDLLMAAYGKYQWILPQAATVIPLTEIFDLRRRVARDQVLLAEEGDRVTAVAVWDPTPSEQDPFWPRHWARLRIIAVEPGPPSLERGRRLLDRCAAEARACGAIALGLHLARPAGVPAFAGLPLRRAPHLDYVIGTDDGMWETERMPVLAYAWSLPVD
jgi:hypothetical protein